MEVIEKTIENEVVEERMRDLLRRHDRSSSQRPFGGYTDQTVSNLSNTFLEAGLLGLPSAPAKSIQQPFFVAKAA